MNELALADTARPAPVVVLKLPLRPYTLGHELLLLSWRNPLVLYAPEDFAQLSYVEQIRAIHQAAWICSNTWAENHGERLLRLKQAIWHWRLRSENYPLAIADFRNYLAAGQQLPQTLNAANSADVEAYEIANGGEKLEMGRCSGSPFLASLVNFCIAKKLAKAFGVSTVFDVSYAFAGQLYIAWLESKGRVYVENYREAEERATMAANHADANRKMAERAAAQAQSQAQTEEAPCQP